MLTTLFHQSNCTAIDQDSESSSVIPAFATTSNQHKQTKKIISNRKCYSFHRKEFRRKKFVGPGWSFSLSYLINSYLKSFLIATQTFHKLSHFFLKIIFFYVCFLKYCWIQNTHSIKMQNNCLLSSIDENFSSTFQKLLKYLGNIFELSLNCLHKTSFLRMILRKFNGLKF